MEFGFKHKNTLTEQKKTVMAVQFCINVARSIPHKICHFRDIVPSQSAGLVLTEPNLTEQKQTTQEQYSLS